MLFGSNTAQPSFMNSIFILEEGACGVNQAHLAFFVITLYYLVHDVPLTSFCFCAVSRAELSGVPTPGNSGSAASHVRVLCHHVSLADIEHAWTKSACDEVLISCSQNGLGVIYIPLVGFNRRPFRIV